ncbi:MAG: FHA domain-containing protein [Actinobacteria bacterium]|nr:FHA domain-containing protein [Actinomycetota bacterium]
MLQIVLLVGKFAFLLVLYIFIYRVVRSATRELRGAAPLFEKRPWSADVGGHMPGVGPAPATGGRPGGVWSLVVQKSPSLSKGMVYAFPEGSRALVGRSADADIQLDDTFVSSKHSVFQSANGGLLVEDLRSTNGTQVNGADISDARVLQIGDRVEVGDTVFQVEVR